MTTAMLSPVILSGLAATVSVSQLYGRIRAQFLLVASMACFCVGNNLIAMVPIDQTYWAQVFVVTLVTPFGMDISFPAASLIVSNSMPTEKQGVAASMVNTAINWSISLGLGIAGTVESVMIRRGKTALEGYRSALYTGIGLSGAGVMVGLIFCRVPAVPIASEVERAQKEDAPASNSCEHTIRGRRRHLILRYSSDGSCGINAHFSVEFIFSREETMRRHTYQKLATM